MTGDGSDYRGCQTRTASGILCQGWDTQDSPHNHSYTSANYPTDGLRANYCRNPRNASTIWCMTTNSDKRWEQCIPIGVVSPECTTGYEIDKQYSRDALRICAYCVWALCGVWIILVVCMYKRIKLAIAINQVAAKFISHHPSTLLVPIVQVIVSCTYSVLWAISASFLLSQVPANYTSKLSYATWDEAMGTATVPGACNPKWPDGFAWKYGGNLSSTNDLCSGNMGDTTGITPKCWKCAPPRYAFDYYFLYSLFSYFWNNALFVAIGQCVIAVAVGMWFFTKQEEKGKHSPTWKAVKLVMRYHLGSLAFGSFIIAICQLVRAILKYMEKQAEMQKNRVMQLVLKAVQCCMWCFEKCLKFLNKNAYIQIALLGKGFCISAKNAFFLIFRNLARFGTMMVLGSIIHFVGSTVIVVGTTLSGYFILQMLHPAASPVMPVLIYLAMAYVVAKLFMNVFGLAVDTSLQCFIVAEEHKLDKDCVPKQLRSLLNGNDSKKVKPDPE